MRPVAANFARSQPFGGMPTAGVAPSWVPNTVGWYVRLYGNYQPFGHAGEDIACPVGTPVYAIADGEVVWADWGYNLPGDESDWGYRQRWYFYKSFPGILTVIKHPQLGPNVYTAYAHLSNNDHAPVGSRVKRGQLIALSGNTGGVAAHLHVEYLRDPSYSTGGGLIYGRDNPAKLYGALTPSGTVTPIKKEDLPLSRAEVNEIKNYMAALLIYGYTSGGRKHPGVAAVVEQNQREIRALPKAVWEVPVVRGGGKVSALQELADAKTLGQQNKATLAEIEALLTPEALADLIPSSMAQQVIDALADRLAGPPAAA